MKVPTSISLLGKVLPLAVQESSGRRQKLIDRMISVYQHIKRRVTYLQQHHQNWVDLQDSFDKRLASRDNIQRPISIF